jgi:S1-C subfamily serine protease
LGEHSEEVVTYQINAMHQSTQLLFSTVRIQVRFADGKSGVGTAFFFDYGEPESWRTYLVTNKHVVEGVVEAQITFHIASNPQLHELNPPGKALVRFNDFEREWFPHPDPDVDICVMAVDHLKRLALGALDNLFYRQMGSHGVKTDEELGKFPAITHRSLG